MSKLCNKGYGGSDDVKIADATSLPLAVPAQPNKARTGNPAPHATSYPIVTIYLGQHKEKILVPTQFLKQSEWFGRALNSNCTIFTFTREDPCDMRLFFEHLEKGFYTIPRDDYRPHRDSCGVRVGSTYADLAEKFPACRFDIHSRHARLYMLGERFEVPHLRDYALNAMWNLLVVEDPLVILEYKRFYIFLEERLHLIRRVYRTPRLYTVELRKLLAFKVAENWSLYMSLMEVNKRYKGRLTFKDFITGAPTFVYDVIMYLGDSQTTLASAGKRGFLDKLQAEKALHR